MLRNLIEKLRAKFPATYTCGYSMAKIALLDDAFLLVFEWEASPVEVQSLKQKDKEMRKRKGKKSPKTSQFFYFCACPSKNVVGCNTSGKKGMLSCCKCPLGYTGANLAHIQPENLQTVQNKDFGKKLWELMG